MGVCPAQSFARSSVRVTVVPFSTNFTVSQIWHPTTAAPARRASLTTSEIVSGRLLAFERCADVDQIVLVVRKDQLIAAKAVVRMFGISKVRAVVAGGAKRQDSVMNGLKELDVDTRFVVVHDGARPSSLRTAFRAISAARRGGIRWRRR